MNRTPYSSSALGLERPRGRKWPTPLPPWAASEYKLYGAFTPHISAPAMWLHYEKLYGGYLARTGARLHLRAPHLWNDLNRFAHTMRRDPAAFADATQAWNHAFFWSSIWPNPHAEQREPRGRLRAAIESERSVEEFRHVFVEVGSRVVGSGWVFLVASPDGARVSIRSYSNTENPLVALPRLRPLAVCDVWEHAYLCDHGADRVRWLDHFIRYLWRPEFSERVLLSE